MYILLVLFYFSKNILLFTTYRTISCIRYPAGFNFSASCFKKAVSL